VISWSVVFAASVQYVTVPHSHLKSLHFSLPLQPPSKPIHCNLLTGWNLTLLGWLVSTSYFPGWPISIHQISKTLLGLCIFCGVFLNQPLLSSSELTHSVPIYLITHLYGHRDFYQILLNHSFSAYFFPRVGEIFAFHILWPPPCPNHSFSAGYMVQNSVHGEKFTTLSSSARILSILRDCELVSKIEWLE
jgi:hypothetical protein